MNSDEFEAFYHKACSFDRHLGMRLNVYGPGQIRYRLTIGEQHLSVPTACHGGVIAAMMDAVLGVTALSWAADRDQLCATVEFKTHFFEEVKPGDELEGTGAIDFAGTRLVVTTGSIVDLTTGQPVAKGMGTFNLYPLAKKKDMIDALMQH